MLAFQFPDPFLGLGDLDAADDQKDDGNNGDQCERVEERGVRRGVPGMSRVGDEALL